MIGIPGLIDILYTPNILNKNEGISDSILSVYELIIDFNNLYSAFLMDFKIKLWSLVK